MAVGVLMWTKYVVAYLADDNAFSRFLLYAGRILFTVVAAAAFINCFTPVLFWFDENGVSHTLLQVFEGVVEVHLLYPDGTVSQEGRKFSAGQEASIWGNDETSDYDQTDSDIDYYALDIPTLEFLKVGISNGVDEYVLTIPDVDEIIRIKQSYFDVTFMADGRVFGTQSVLFDHCATQPSLRPAVSGSWDFDFSTPIRGNTEFHWKN
jgi:hypothetical protein